MFDLTLNGKYVAVEATSSTMALPAFAVATSGEVKYAYAPTVDDVIDQAPMAFVFTPEGMLREYAVAVADGVVALLTSITGVAHKNSSPFCENARMWDEASVLIAPIRRFLV